MKILGAFWRYPLCDPALSAIIRGGGYRLWWYGLFVGPCSIGIMVRRREAVRRERG